MPTAAPAFDISAPSVIGFARDATHADFEALNDVAIAQDDFVTSWASFATWAERAGVSAHTSSPRFIIRASGTTFRLRETGFGYLFVEPSGRHKLIEGVQTDDDLIAAACEFFSSPAVRAACQPRE